MYVFRQFKKNRALRFVNIIGLSVVFACLLLSYGYVKHELSYDLHNENAGRMVRMSLQTDNNPVDGRIYGNGIDWILQQTPEIEQVVKMQKGSFTILTSKDESQIVDNFYFADPSIFDVFSIPLLTGDKERVFEATNQVVISESLARRLFGGELPDKDQKPELLLNGRWIGGTGSVFFVSGIFKDLPETSHFKTDILLPKTEQQGGYSYVYLLLKEQTDIRELERKLTQALQTDSQEKGTAVKSMALLMPVTDIHLHSHNLREMEPNGNVNYIYLVIGANALLLMVVLFNLWLNQSLIFSYSRKYYRLLRINGASSYTVVKDEAILSLLTGAIVLAAGIAAMYGVVSTGYFSIRIGYLDIALLSVLFLTIIAAVSVLPVAANLSVTMFLNTKDDLKSAGFSGSNVKYMQMLQYVIVMATVILAFGIGKQMRMVRHTQLGGDARNILVTNEQSYDVLERFSMLKSELLKHSEIEAVTACFQPPGEAIRDYISVTPEGSSEPVRLPVLIADGDFLSFFYVEPIAGREFQPIKYTIEQEYVMYERFCNNEKNDFVEEYVINRKALAALGFDLPEAAVGKTLRVEDSTLGYISSGIIVGVTDDFNYTGVFESAIPMLVMQRSIFLHHFMVRLNPDRLQESTDVFNAVWRQVNPDCPAGYTFSSDAFGKTYRNELNAERLVSVFSLLCFVIADLGLIIFMAFIIRRRTKEIGIRKVFGASTGEIVALLNLKFVRYIAVAFAIAVPLSVFVMLRWMRHFAYKTQLDWWIFALAGGVVLLLSVASISLQSWRAATANPIDSIKIE